MSRKTKKIKAEKAKKTRKRTRDYKIRANYIVIGILLILATLFMIVNELGIVSLEFADIKAWQIIVGAVLLCLVVNSFMKLYVPLAFLPLGLLFIVFEKQFALLAGKEDGRLINHWIVFLAILMLTVATWLLFSVKDKKPFSPLKGIRRKKKVSETDGDARFTFADGEKYIDCRKFTYEKVENNFGTLDICFINTDEYEGGGELEIDNAFGDIAIYVPQDWKIINQCSVNLGAGEHDGDNVDNAKTLTVSGASKMGGVEIKRR